LTSQDLLCARCARQGTTCCQGTEIHVTWGDVRRITLETGIGGFYEYAGADNPAYEDQSDDPIWQKHVFQLDGTRRILKKRETGDCSFLGAEGCLLTLDARPLVCRLFPFTYDAAGLHAGPGSSCPAHLLKPNESLLAHLNMSLETAKIWHRILYEEILHDGNHHRLDLRPAL
jgi:Fe-S-cluster containining protein